MTMDISRYEVLLKDPGKSSQELQNMRRNALAKNAFEHARLAELVLGPIWHPRLVPPVAGA